MFGEPEVDVIDEEEETARKPFNLPGRFAAARGQILQGLSREVSGGEAGADSDKQQVKPLCGVKETYYKARDDAIFMRTSDRDPFTNMDEDGRAKLMKSISDDQAASLRNIDQRRRRDSLASQFSIEKQMKHHHLAPSSPSSSPKRSAAPTTATSTGAGGATRRHNSDSSDGDISASFVTRNSRKRASILRSRLASIDESKQDTSTNNTDCTVRSRGSSRSAGSVGSSFAVTSLTFDPSKRLSVLSELDDSLSEEIGDWSFAASQNVSSRNILGDDMLNYYTNQKL